MDTLQAIRQRKSYRGHFKSDPVPREDLRELLEAGFLAPSGCNAQSTKFVGADDPVIVKRLAEIYGVPWAASAPAAIVLLTKFTMTPSGASYHIQDYSAATENILLAIAAKGYATTWLEGQIRGDKGKEMCRVLGAPEDMTVAVYLPFGIPEGEAASVKKLSYDERVWFNRYGNAE